MEVILIILSFIFSPLLTLYFIYMVLKEGLCKVCYLYYLAFTGFNKYRKGFRYPIYILALKKLNYMFAKYFIYRILF